MKLEEALQLSDVGVALISETGETLFMNRAFKQVISSNAADQVHVKDTHLPDGSCLSICVPLPDRLMTERSRPHVLVAEDGDANRLLAMTLLQKAGCKVTCVNNGAAAISALGDSSFDLILMDLSMPLLDGFQACQAIRQLDGAQSHTPIIAATAHDGTELIKRCLESGMNGVLVKPISKQQIHKILADHLGFTAVENDNSDAASHRAPCKPIIAGADPTGPELDHQILEQLFNDAGPEGARLGLEIYLEEAKDRLSDIAAALENNDWAGIGKHAHSLKSASGTFGLTRLQQHCASMQNAENLGRVDELMSLAKSLPETADPSLEALSLYLQAVEA